MNNTRKTGGVYGADPASWFLAEGYWDRPLESLPGTQYHYTNMNFILAGYVVEKDPGPRTPDPGPRTPDPGPRTPDRTPDPEP